MYIRKTYTNEEFTDDYTDKARDDLFAPVTQPSVSYKIWNAVLDIKTCFICADKEVKYLKKATIDLTDCKYLMELHERIKDGLKLQDGYGRNWDAFWDDINRNIEFNFITIKGSKTVADELKGSVEIMHELLEDNKQYWAHCSSPFDYEFVD